MTGVSEERLLAWLDGELDATEAAEIARAVAADPALAERARRERALRERLRAAFAPAAEETLPQRLLATLGMAEEEKSDDKVVPLRPRGTIRRVREWRWPEWTALAASVLLGAVFGAQFLHAPAQGPVRMLDGTLVAGSALAKTLDGELAADARPGDALAVGLSFRDGEGRYCRTFTARGAQPLGGLACRDNDNSRWNVVALGEAKRQQGELRQAVSALPVSVLAEVDARQQHMLDAAAERAARDAGWR